MYCSRARQTLKFVRNYYSTLPSTSTTLKPTSDWEKRLTENQFHKLLLIKAEYELQKFTDPLLPSEVNDSDWKVLLDFDSLSARIRYLNSLRNREIRRQLRSDRRDSFNERRLEGTNVKTVQIDQAVKTSGIYYGLSASGIAGNTILLRLNRVMMNAFYDYRVALAHQLGPKIVIDASSYSSLSFSRQSAALLHLSKAVTANRIHQMPSNLMLTGVDLNRGSDQKPTTIHQLEHCFQDDFVGLGTSERHFTELYPCENLVYLVHPGLGHNLQRTKFDEDVDCFVLPLIHDAASHTAVMNMFPRLRYRSVPIDLFLRWTNSPKKLLLHQMVNILLDFNLRANWNEALRNNIPNRYYL